MRSVADIPDDLTIKQVYGISTIKGVGYEVTIKEAWSNMRLSNYFPSQGGIASGMFLLLYIPSKVFNIKP